jgi:hypothetical protein
LLFKRLRLLLLEKPFWRLDNRWRHSPRRRRRQYPDR